MNINYPQILGDVKLQQGPFRYSLVKMTDLIDDKYQTWKGQRSLNKQHVSELTKSFINCINNTKTIKYCSSVPHIVITPKGKKHIIDGQHRIEAFKEICKKHNNAYDVLVLYEQCDTYKEIKEAFDRSNTVWAQSDKVIDSIFNTKEENEEKEEEKEEIPMPKKEIINSLWNNKIMKYNGTKGMISRASKPQKPNLNENDMLDKLETASEQNYIIFSTYNELDNLYNNANISIKKSALCLEYKEKHPDKWIKCEKYDCFIGLVKDFTKYMTAEISPKAVDEGEKKQRQSPPAPVRRALWKKYYGTSLEGGCWACTTENIDPWNFHAGHIKPHKEGGEAKVDNLVPLCASCNTSMGAMNAHEYKEKYFKK